MTRGKQIRRMIAMAMVAAMTMSSMSIVAFAEDGNASTASESNNSESGGFGDGGSDNSGTDNGGSDNISPVTSGEESVAKDGPINITIEGIQNLKESVYLYTSEIHNEGAANEVSSQTLVGMASGNHEVKVSQNIEFRFEVEDEKVVVRERHSGGGRKDRKEPPKSPETPEIPAVPEAEEMIEEEVPLSNIPKTGDASLAWLAMSGISALAPAIRKRR